MNRDRSFVFRRVFDFGAEECAVSRERDSGVEEGLSLSLEVEVVCGGVTVLIVS